MNCNRFKIKNNMQRWALNSFFSCPNGMEWNKAGRSRGGIQTSHSNHQTKLSWVSQLEWRTVNTEQYAVCVIHILFSVSPLEYPGEVSVFGRFMRNYSMWLCVFERAPFVRCPVCAHTCVCWLSRSWRLIPILLVSNEMHFVYHLPSISLAPLTCSTRRNCL